MCYALNIICRKLSDFEKISGIITVPVVWPFKVFSQLLQFPCHLTYVCLIYRALHIPKIDRL